MNFSWYEKVGFGLLIAAWVVWGSDKIGGMLVHAKGMEKPAYAVAAAEADDAKAEAGKPAVDAMTLLASAAADAGEKVFKKCKACHTVEKGGKNTVGPNLWNVVGRAKGSGEGFSYSDAVKGLGGEWTFADLNAFLENPKGFAKGTKMSFAGLKKPEDRAEVIVYLRSLSDSPKPLP
ncbi:MAG: cytochrome c family protein [Rhodospirillaceae bacterium]